MLVRVWRGEGVSGHRAGLRGESKCWWRGEGGRSEPVRERPSSGERWSWCCSLVSLASDDHDSAACRSLVDNQSVVYI